VKFPSILPPPDLLQQISGIEQGLQQQRRLSRVGRFAVLAAVIQAMAVIINSGFWDTFTEANWHDLFFGQGNQPGLLDKWPFLLALAIALLAVFFLGWMRFWLKESQAPFRYTFEVDEFHAIGDQKDESLRWLRHHLSTRLNDRIGRLSLLEPDHAGNGTKPDDGAQAALASRPAPGESHVRIRGHWGIRLVEDPEEACWWQLEVITKVRVGGEGAPETLAHPVTWRLDELDRGGDGCEPNETTPHQLRPDEYENVVERVYFSVATEIYKQMREDVQHKIELLPTPYLRARAYFYEAEDYARSNTLDAYDEARKLYDAAIAYFTPGTRPRPRSLLRLVAYYLRWAGAAVRRAFRVAGALVWNRPAKVEFMVARAEVGYANVLISRRMLAGASGRAVNPVYEARPMALEAVRRLSLLPRDVPGARDARFDARVTLALAWAFLGSSRKAKQELTEARRLLPSRPEYDSRFLYASALAESRPRSRLLLLERAVELTPESEAAQLELALQAEMLWRARPGLEPSVAAAVLVEYDNVAQQNPGNLAAWANKGYLRWLLADDKDELGRAKREFADGRLYKAIKRETYVAELDYGLGRIAAEEGNFLRAFQHLTDAVTAHFALGLQGSNRWSALSDYYFAYIDRRMLDRFSRYKETVRDNYAKEEPSALRDSVLAFVLNDYGEACFNYYLRSADRSYAVEAYEAYKEARGLDTSNAIPRYNLYWLARMLGDKFAGTDLRPHSRYAEELREIERDWVETKFLVMALRFEQVTEHRRMELEARDQGSRTRSALERHGSEAGKSEPQENQFEGGSMAAPYKLEKDTRDWKRERQTLERERDANESAAAFHRDQADTARRQADEILQELLPHDWLWRSRRGRSSLRVKLFKHRRWRRRRARFGNALRWERELNELHVRALLEGGEMHGSQAGGRSSDAGRIFAFIEDCFLPDNFEILRSFRDQVEQRLGRPASRWSRAIARRVRPGTIWMAALAPVLTVLDPYMRTQRKTVKYNTVRTAVIESSMELNPSAWWALETLQDQYVATVRAFGETLLVRCSTLALRSRIEFLEQASKVEGLTAAFYRDVGAWLWALDAELEEQRPRAARAVWECAQSLKAGKLAEARSALDALRETTIDAEALTGLRSALGSRDVVKSLEDLTSRIEPGDERARQDVRRAALRAYERAIFAKDVFTRAGPDVLQQVVSAFTALAPGEQALEVLERRLTADGNDLAALWPVLEAFKKLASPDQALAMLRRYESLLGGDDPGLLWRLAECYAELKSWRWSLATYERAAEADEARPEHERSHSKDEYHLQRARLHWILGKRRSALALLDRIRERDEKLPPAWRTLFVNALVASGQLSSRSGYLQLRAWLEWQQQRGGPARGAVRQDAGRALLALAATARRPDLTAEWSVPERFEQAGNMFPATNPIILEAHPDLFRQDDQTPGVKKMIGEHIPRMRDGILQDTGLLVPGVLIRKGNPEELGDGDYLVMLHEVALASGNAKEGTHRPYRQMVARGVEPAVRNHLDAFLGRQEVAELLGQWQREAVTDEERSRRQALVPEDRSRLDQVLQRLVRQQVSLRELDPILTGLQDGQADDDLHDLHDLLDIVRARLGEQLPGRDRTCLPLDGELEERLRSWLCDGREGERFLAVPADQERVFWSLTEEIRRRVAEHEGGRLALMVEDAGLRGFVQEIVDGRVPDLVVLSRSELGDGRPAERLDPVVLPTPKEAPV
jgi:FHIPEP family